MARDNHNHTFAKLGQFVAKENITPKINSLSLEDAKAGEAPRFAIVHCKFFRPNEMHETNVLCFIFLLFFAVFCYVFAVFLFQKMQ